MHARIHDAFAARRTVVGLATAAALLTAAAGQAAEPISFKRHLFMIIQGRCLACHQPGGDGYEKSGLDLRTYEGLMKGTKHGPVVVPGDAFTSNLNVMVEGRADSSLRMPHDGSRLSPHEIDVFRRWVADGAKNN